MVVCSEAFTMISSETISTGIILLVIFILIFFLYWNGSNKKLPPGPWGIPVFGVLLFLDKPPHIKFQQYFHKYGKLCSFNIGNKLVAVISDFNLIKEAFVQKGDIFSGRPEDIAFKVFPQDKGLGTSEGNDFRQYKSFIVSTLKDAGAVRAQFENIVKSNVDHFIEYINEMNEKTVNILEPLGLSIAQTFSQLLFGNQLQHNDPILKELVSLCIQENTHYYNGARVYLSWTKKIPLVSKYIGEDDIRKIRSRIYEIFESILKENVDSYIEGSRENFVHSWLTEDAKRKSKNPNDNLFGRNALYHNLLEIFEAGYETTTSTLRLAFLFLLNYPDVQEKIMQELDKVVGHDRLPCLDDESFLPYTLATIQEIHRCATILPLALPHKTRESTILDGYHIPKNTIVYANVYSVHFDPLLFSDPYKFKPERFIDEKGKFFKSEHILSFSIGKRRCPGEKMAQAEIFIYLTYLLQNFRFVKAGDVNLLGSKGGSNFLDIPKNLSLKFVNRKEKNLKITD